MTGLKPCPFCGGEARLTKNYMAQTYIYCRNCWAEVWGAKDQMNDEEIVEAWNRRVSDGK